MWRGLDWCDPVPEEVLVDVCVHDMIDGHKIYLENLSFSCSSKIIEALRRPNKSVEDYKVFLFDQVQLVG